MEDDKGELDPTDIFSSSLESLYDYQPITLASAGAVYTYDSKAKPSSSGESDITSSKVTLVTPDTLPANWFLHASDVWVSSQYLADHLDVLDLQAFSSKVSGGKVRVLELGAAAGLPGILIAKTYNNMSVTVSDYPDELLIKTLSENVSRNGVSDSCRAVAYAWGSNPSPLLEDGNRFDVVVAADTLWNPSLHSIFVETLRLTLKRSAWARIHLIAGLHTGRYAIQSFLDAVQEAGFDIESAIEKQVKGFGEKAWNVSGDEDDRERRRWVVWTVLRWKTTELEVV